MRAFISLSLHLYFHNCTAHVKHKRHYVSAQLAKADFELSIAKILKSPSDSFSNDV
jgi:hypothetical protein